MRALPGLTAFFVAGALAASAACDSSLRVGDLREQAPDADTPSGLTSDAGTDAAVGVTSWRLHTPIVPCSIYALAEVRTDDLFVGCNGGRIYRFDGVQAKVSLEVEDAGVFSLLWMAPDGQVWAAAQSSYDAGAKSQVHRFDGKTWTKAEVGTDRIMALTGAGAGDVWIATATTLSRFEGASFSPKYTAITGAFRGCAFASPNEGYCVGTQGLAVKWDGATWSPMPSPPWSAQAEIFGVELNPFTKLPTFLYGEPYSGSNGDHAVHAARWTGAAFATYLATIPTFTGYDMSRKRTGHVVIGGATYMLLSVNEQYGQALLFDGAADSFRELCGPVLAFSAGSANTRVGGLDGLLATIVGSGGTQAALDPIGSSNLDFDDLGVAIDGSTWARTQDSTACGTITDKLVRFERGAWSTVPAPQGALSGRGLAVISLDHAYTISLVSDGLAHYQAGNWTEDAKLDQPWSLFARTANDVWIGGSRDNFAHFDGKEVRVVAPPGRGRQIEQILAVGPEVWMVAHGYSQNDTAIHAYRYADGKLTDWDLGIDVAGAKVQISALDPSHVYRSGSPAAAWDGTRWKELSFEASGVWARAADEVYFTSGGDIYRYDGVKRERVYHGFIPITAIDGSKDRGFAIGPGGLTIELATWPPETK